MSTSARLSCVKHAKASQRRGLDILRLPVIFRGKTFDVTQRLNLPRFSLVHKSRLLSILAPPSFPPFRSLKTRLQCRHLLLPHRFVFSCTYFIMWSTRTVFHLPCSCVVFCDRNQVTASWPKGTASRKHTSTTAASVTLLFERENTRRVVNAELLQNSNYPCSETSET